MDRRLRRDTRPRETDASTKKDSTAIVGCTFDGKEKKVRLVTHRLFQPSPKDPLDFETTIETSLLDLKKRFRMMRVFYDPWQMVSVGQRLSKAGLPMEEFPQTVPNLTEASQNLYDLIKGRNLIVYPDRDIRLGSSPGMDLPDDTAVWSYKRAWRGIFGPSLQVRTRF